MPKIQLDSERLCYSVRETAHLLGLSVSNTYTLCESGLLPCRKLRGRRLVPRKALLAWIEGNDVSAAGAEGDHGTGTAS